VHSICIFKRAPGTTATMIYYYYVGRMKIKQ